MKCPACLAEMNEITAGDIKIDVCDRGCGGIWFDDGELRKFDNGKEFDPTSLLKVSSTGHSSPTETIRKCPRCSDSVLVKQYSDIENKVQIDQCWECSGILLDRGELAILRSQFNNDADHVAAVNAYAQNCIDKQIKSVEKAGAERIKQIREENSNSYNASISAFKELFGRQKY